MSISVVGRFFPNPVIEVTPGTVNVAIRIDDAKNSEPWVEVYITWEYLDQLRAAAHAGLSVDQDTAEPIAFAVIPELPPEVPDLTIPALKPPTGQK